MDIKDKPKNPAFIIDSSALKDMFEGKKEGDKLLALLKERDNSGKNIFMITPAASFLRALFLADPEIKIGVIQKAMSIMKIIYLGVDYQDEKKVTDELTNFAAALSGGKK